MSIATELQNYNDGLLDAYTAVNTKGGTVPNNKNLANLDSAIASIPAGGGAEEKDINFYDYDGNLVEAWTLAELANKTELPANPTAPTGLTAAGWNWTLAELQTENKMTNVGQLYHPTDDKTHLFVEVDADHLSPYLSFGLNGTATIDWGDGSETSTLSGWSESNRVTEQHTYAQAGSYDVTIEISGNGRGRLTGYSSYCWWLWIYTTSQSSYSSDNVTCAAQVRKLWLGRNMDIGNNGTQYGGFHEILIPDYYPSTTVGNSFLNKVARVDKPIILPRAITTIAQLFGGVNYTFNQLVILPPTVTSISNNFLGGTPAPYTYPPVTFPLVYNKNLTIPSSVTTIGDNFLAGCASFNSELSLPNALLSIGTYFMAGCFTFEGKIVVPSTIEGIQSGFLAYDGNITAIETNTNIYPQDANNTLTSYYAADVAVQEGIVLTGTGAATWVANLPNSTTRKLIDGTV